MNYSMDMLLEQINIVVKRPSATELMLIGIKAVREIFQLIGLELTTDFRADNFSVKDNKVILGYDIIRVEDAGPIDATKGQAYQAQNGMSLSGKYVFRQQGFDLHFPNMTNEEVRLWYWGFYVDPLDKSLLIHADVMEACKLMGQYYGIEGDFDHPAYRERDILYQKAKQEAFIARGNLNRSTIAQKRTDRRLL